MSFQITVTMITCLSDFLKMVITVLNTTFAKWFLKTSSAETIRSLIGTNSKEKWKQELMKTAMFPVNITFWGRLSCLQKQSVGGVL